MYLVSALPGTRRRAEVLGAGISVSCGYADDGREPGAGPRAAAWGTSEPELEGRTGTGAGPRASVRGLRQEKVEQHTEEGCDEDKTS